jgi:Na+(H+)/acetate symporter ActP
VVECLRDLRGVPVCGEYLSAASFLGVAGLVLAFGVDILWYPVGYTAGYLVLLALVAAPLRRSGAYTLPDFAEIRLQSPLIRRIGWLGSVTSKERNEAKYSEMEVRSLAGAEKAISH